MPIHPLPPAHISTILGLLEVLDDGGGREDLSKLGATLPVDLGDLLQLLNAGQALGLVTVRDGDVLLTPVGEKVVRGDIATRKAVLGQQVRAVDVMREVMALLAARRSKRMPRASLMSLFERYLPAREARELFVTLLDWGRYAQLLDYRERTGDIVLVGSSEAKAR